MMTHVLYLTMLVTGLCISAKAQSAKIEEPIAAVAADSTEIKWQPRVEYARLVLTVSTPSGEVLRKEFEAGNLPSFKFIDDNGVKMPDGQYVYELQVVPNLTREARKALAAARKDGNDEAVRELQRRGEVPSEAAVQSGSFLVKEGVVYLAGPEEPGTGRKASK